MPDLYRYVHYACGFVDFEGKNKNDISTLMGEFIRFCDSYSKIHKYYLLAHDNTDILHIHFVFYSISQVQVMTYFNKLRSFFIDKLKLVRGDGGISIEKCENINAYLLYMMHQDKKSLTEGKKQYTIDDFISNDDIENIDMMSHSKKGVIDAFYLRDAVLDNLNDFDLMVALTLPVFHKYRYEIEIMKQNRSLLVLRREEERKEKLDNQLPF